MKNQLLGGKQVGRSVLIPVVEYSHRFRTIWNHLECSIDAIKVSKTDADESGAEQQLNTLSTVSKKSRHR